MNKVTGVKGSALKMGHNSDRLRIKAWWPGIDREAERLQNQLSWMTWDDNPANTFRTNQVNTPAQRAHSH